MCGRGGWPCGAFLTVALFLFCVPMTSFYGDTVHLRDASMVQGMIFRQTRQAIYLQTGA